MLSDLNYGGRVTPVIMQLEGSECGLACLAMVAAHYGLFVDLPDLRRRFQISLKGASLKDLMKTAEDIGFAVRPLRGEIEDLAQVVLPAVLHWDLNHFVVLTRISRSVKGRRFYVHDPASGIRRYTESEFSRHFTGVFLELTRTEGFTPQRPQANLKIGQLWSRIEGFWPVFQQVLVLSSVLQLIILVIPLFMQVAVDTVLPASDEDLLLVLALGFAGVSAISMITSWVRSLVLLRLSTTLSYQVNTNLFNHLLRLPLSWFERRHIGDIVSRFGSTKPVTDLISQGLIAAIIDGVMAVTTLALLLTYSATIGSISIAAIALVVALRLGFFGALKRANVNLIMAGAKENSVFIESLRGISTIKAFGEEANRQRLWQNRKADAVNAEIKSGRLFAGFSASEQFLLGAEKVVFVYVGVNCVIKGTLSIGMVFALQAYRQQFLDTMIRLIQQLVSYRLLDMHLARIADIALSVPEGSNTVANEPRSRGGVARISLRNIRFQYGVHEPEVLKGVNLDVEPGEMIALLGVSGSGKTTLMKIMMGLLSPTAGEVLIDGTPLATYGVVRWRREIASVAQDDALFAGSLADNICMFDPQPDDRKMRMVSKAADIDSDIAAFPMRYNTPIGDMGSALSGGQKQRVMLARALYREPVALFLDEATAHLDSESEAKVGEVVQSLQCTRVAIAHRPQTIERANRVYMLKFGVLHPVQLSRQ